MYKVSIQGGRRLKGAIQISGAKNAALPLMAASLLTESDIKLSNIPEVVDIATMQSLLTIHGASFELMNEKTSKKLNPNKKTELPRCYVEKQPTIKNEQQKD